MSRCGWPPQYTGDLQGASRQSPLRLRPRGCERDPPGLRATLLGLRGPQPAAARHAPAGCCPRRAQGWEKSRCRFLWTRRPPVRGPRNPAGRPARPPDFPEEGMGFPAGRSSRRPAALPGGCSGTFRQAWAACLAPPTPARASA